MRKSFFRAALKRTGVRAGACVAALVLTSDVYATDCGSLAGKIFGNATVTAATSVAPPSSFSGKDPRLAVSVKAPFCRVQGAINPSVDSDINFEVWLPPAGNWNGKYQGVGNGGFAGSLILNPMTWSLEAGYAVSGTDTGHSGGPLDSRWALGHPEKIVDFGWRAIHETADASKAIIADYYGKAPAHAYFSGCSDGGREALMEAQRFPKDYDGIVAGAPANYWTKLLTNSVGIEQALEQRNGWLSPEKLSIVTKAVLAACHGEDGYIGDPRQCHFDPSSVVCKTGQSDGCLSEPEAAALRKIYSGAEGSDGKPIFPGYSPGGEAGQAAWALWITGSDPKRTAGSLLYGFGTGYFANMVYHKTDWRIGDENVSDDLAEAVKQTGTALDAADPDLSAFKAAGGKLIQYHGWSDAGVPPRSSIDYYESVVAKMAGPDAVRSFYRLFMAPGMAHCGGGPAPNAIGGVFGSPSPSRDPKHDLVVALAHWVEDGVAPDEMVATGYRDGDPSKGIEAQRLWCAYPETARYSGQGDRKDPASFACVTPAK
jgi:Tannase and feruloyl esterase